MTMTAEDARVLAALNAARALDLKMLNYRRVPEVTDLSEWSNRYDVKRMRAALAAADAVVAAPDTTDDALRALIGGAREGLDQSIGGDLITTGTSEAVSAVDRGVLAGVLAAASVGACLTGLLDEEAVALADAILAAGFSRAVPEAIDREALADLLRSAGVTSKAPTFGGTPEEIVLSSLDKVLDALSRAVPETETEWEYAVKHISVDGWATIQEWVSLEDAQTEIATCGFNCSLVRAPKRVWGPLPERGEG